MTYLIHSVSYLPSGLSSWTYESYKHIYCFILGDRKRGEGYAVEAGGKGEDGLINVSRPHRAGLGHGRTYPVSVDSRPCKGLEARPASSLVWKLASQPIATTLAEMHFKRERLCSSAVWPFFQLRGVCVCVCVCVCVWRRERGREEETICWPWNYFCTFIQITPNWTGNLWAYLAMPALLITIPWPFLLYKTTIWERLGGNNLNANTSLLCFGILVQNQTSLSLVPFK